MIACPACGFGLPWEERWAQSLACPSCRSLLVPDAGRLVRAGEAGVPLARGIGLAVGDRGTVDGQGFTVMGRARWSWERGSWDEWAVRLDDGGHRWISDDGERLTIEDDGVEAGRVRDPGRLAPGNRVRLGTRLWTVREAGIATLAGIEGQLPDDARPGTALRFADLVSGEAFATLDCAGDGRITLHQGRDATLGDLGIPARHPFADGARTTAAALACAACAAPLPAPAAGATESVCDHCGTRLDLAAERIPCPGCGVALPLLGRAAGSSWIGCPHCAAAVDVRAATPVLLGRLSRGDRPPSPHRLGDRLRFGTQDWRIVGRVRWREAWGRKTWSWDEFLLLPTPPTPASRGLGIQWLVVERGHYGLATPMADGPAWNHQHPNPAKPARHQGRLWTATDDEPGTATITWAEGELTWEARIGDRVRFAEWIRPPEAITAAWDGREIEWHHEEHLARPAVAKSAGLSEADLGPIAGVGPLEPYPHGARQLEALVAAGVGILVCLVMALGASAGTPTAALVLPARGDGVELPVAVAGPVEITAAPTLLVLHARVEPAADRWQALAVEVARVGDDGDLLDPTAPAAEAEFAFWDERGRDDEGAWHDRVTEESALVRIAEPGRYAIRAVHEGNGTLQPAHIAVRRDAGISRWWWIVLVAFVGMGAAALGHRMLYDARRSSPPVDPRPTPTRRERRP